MFPVATACCTTAYRRATCVDGGKVYGFRHLLTANQERMDYRRYRELGLPIGGGTVESARNTSLRYAC